MTMDLEKVLAALLRSLQEADVRSKGELLAGVECEEIFAGLVTVILRHSFLLFASGRALLGEETQPFTGPLFDLGRIPFAEVAQLSDVATLELRRCLLRQGGKPVSIAALDLEILGTLYEAILDYGVGRLEGGGLCLLRRKERRKSGSHYTPRSLTEPIVWNALLPVLRRFGKRPTPEQILGVRVCDPAMGSGAFLLEACRQLGETLVSAWANWGGFPKDGDPLEEAQRMVAQTCIYGVDKNPVAVSLARLSLWLLSGDPRLPVTFLDHSLRLGDTLVGFSPGQEGDRRIRAALGRLLSAQGKGTEPFHWKDEFPEIFSRGRSGFDVVLGNPPFVNAIEENLERRFKRWLRYSHPSFSGPADLSCYFLSQSVRLVASDGTVGILLPRTFLSARAAARFRRELLGKMQPKLILLPQTSSVFSSAKVFVVGLVLGKSEDGTATQISTTGVGPDGLWVRIEGENWWEALHEPKDGQRPVPDITPLAAPFELRASMTTQLAYEVLPFLWDDPGARSFKLVTTGLIDPNLCKWGQMPCRYLKRMFVAPCVVPRADVPAGLKRRMVHAQRPKILVAGILGPASRLEAVLDPQGEYMGAISTYTITHPQDDVAALSALCVYLNSTALQERIRKNLGARAMGSGLTTVPKEFLLSLMVPEG